MIIQSQLLFIAIAMFGALCQEILYWYEIRTKLDSEENKKLLHSKSYWSITIAMVVLAGVGTWLIFYEKAMTFTPKIPIGLGAAFPLILKKVIAATQTRDLGSVDPKENEYKFEDMKKIYFK